MAQILISKVQVRRGQELQTGIPRLDPGELGWAEDTEHLYIGKRISEGAVDDENTRVLTENDLGNIFSLIHTQDNVAGNSSYRYRNDVAYINSTATTISTKLDNWVSLTDYDQSLTPSYQQSEGMDITDTLTTAIQDLYFTSGFDQFSRADARRRLIIPSGKYVVRDTTIDLPPYTTLIGEGPGLTTITFCPSQDNQPLFRTVDATGQNFDEGQMDMSIQDNQNARDVRIEGMTLQFTSTNMINAVLVSLDQVVDAEIRNVEFTTANLATATIHGSAIRLRSGEINNDLLDTAPAGNITIDKCKFRNLGSAINQSVGTVNRFFITKNVFNRLQSGVSMWTVNPNTPGPVNGVIDSNRFERISNQAIVLGTDTTNSYAYPGYTISSNNTFKGVGNGADNSNSPISEYGTTSTNTPVITFNSAGNKSVNDVFARRDFANLVVQIPNSTFYYNPYIQGPGAIEDQSVYRRQLSATTNDLVIFPLNGGEQKITMSYELWNSNTGYSRKGSLLINLVGLNAVYTGYVDGDQIGSVSDYYNYSYITEVADSTWNVNSSVAGTYNYVTLQATGFDPADVGDDGPYFIDYQISQIS
jgi:hypothetical protein